MRRVSLLVAAAVAVASLAACDQKPIECNDGTHETSRGRTTCAGHGGVRAAVMPTTYGPPEVRHG